MTRQEAIEQGKNLAAEIRAFQNTVDRSITFALPGDQMVSLCVALARAADAFVVILEGDDEPPPDMVVVGYSQSPGGENKPIYQRAEQTIRPVSPWFEQNGMQVGTGWAGKGNSNG
jgi:hypothetical protein